MRKVLAGPLISILLLAIALPWAVLSFGTEGLLDSIKRVSIPTAALIFAALGANSLAAAYRFKITSKATGHVVRFRQAMAGVAAGSLGGAMFFQLAGQLMARGIVMQRGRMPFAAVVAVTLYERFVAAALSGALALTGAFYLFGRVYLDQQAGGLTFVKIVCGLLAAASGAAWLGYGALARRVFTPLITARLAAQGLKLLLLALLVQIPTMVAYVIAAHALVPQTDTGDLVAASAIVMFAASIPISFAGWGVRELSAIVALGAVGLPVNDAVTAAIMIGAGSMLAMALLLAVGSAAEGDERSKAGDVSAIPKVDHAQALAWCLPIAAAVAVLFQIYVPIGGGLLNVNLADPIALLAGTLFLLRAITTRTLPNWRITGINIAALAATTMLGISLLIGASRFGFTDWALINRFAGWFVLLAFAATGALISMVAGRKGLRVMLLSYVGATLGVAAIELALIMVSVIADGLPKLVEPGNLQAFALNRNFFAFQLLMAVCAGVVLVEQQRFRTVMMTLIIAALWYSGSRSGWGAFVVLMGVAVAFRYASLNEIGLGLVGSAAIICAIAAIAALGAGQTVQLAAIHGPDIVPSAAATAERLMSITRGWEMFLDHPIFGAGLGAFRNLNILTSNSGIPLLIHSTPLWLLAELGLVGFMVFAVPGVAIFLTQARLVRDEPLAAIAVLCIIAFAIMGTPAEMVYQRTFWLIIGATLAVPGSPSVKK